MNFVNDNIKPEKIKLFFWKYCMWTADAWEKYTLLLTCGCEAGSMNQAFSIDFDYSYKANKDASMYHLILLLKQNFILLAVLIFDSAVKAHLMFKFSPNYFCETLRIYPAIMLSKFIKSAHSRYNWLAHSRHPFLVWSKV